MKRYALPVIIAIIIAAPLTIWGLAALTRARGEYAIENAAAAAIHADTTQAGLLPIAIALGSLGVIAALVVTLIITLRQPRQMLTLADNWQAPAQIDATTQSMLRQGRSTPLPMIHAEPVPDLLGKGEVHDL